MWISSINRENQMILSCINIQTFCLINPKPLQKQIICLKGYTISVKVSPACNQWFNLKIKLPH